jgi:hypothetical protein
MHGLPANFNGNVFVGKELELISFSVNTLYFSFGKNLSITVESECVYSIPPEHTEYVETVPVSSSGLMQLLGKVVGVVTAESDGTLTLTFEDGSNLRCIEDSRQYESYHIRLGDIEIHV